MHTFKPGDLALVVRLSGRHEGAQPGEIVTVIGQFVPKDLLELLSLGLGYDYRIMTLQGLEAVATAKTLRPLPPHDEKKEMHEALDRIHEAIEEL